MYSAEDWGTAARLPENKQLLENRWNWVAATRVKASKTEKEEWKEEARAQLVDPSQRKEEVGSKKKQMSCVKAIR